MLHAPLVLPLMLWQVQKLVQTVKLPPLHKEKNLAHITDNMKLKVI